MIQALVLKAAVPVCDPDKHMSDSRSTTATTGVKKKGKDTTATLPFTYSDVFNSSTSDEDDKDKELNDGAEEDDDKERENREKTPTTGMQLILDLLPRCTYFLSSTNLCDQVLATTVIQDCFWRLAPKPRVVLPTLHMHWPMLMIRLSELRHIFLTSYKRTILDSVSTTSSSKPSAALLQTEATTDDLLTTQLSKLSIVPPTPTSTTTATITTTSTTKTTSKTDDSQSKLKPKIEVLSSSSTTSTTPDESNQISSSNIVIESSTSNITNTTTTNPTTTATIRKVVSVDRRVPSSSVSVYGEDDNMLSHGKANTNTNSIDSSSAVAMGLQTLSRKKLHLLPSLLNVFRVLSLVSGDFYSLRFKEEFWPELHLLLLHIYYIELSKIKVVDSATSPTFSNKNNYSNIFTKKPTKSFNLTELNVASSYQSSNTNSTTNTTANNTVPSTNDTKNLPSPSLISSLLKNPSNLDESTRGYINENSSSTWQHHSIYYEVVYELIYTLERIIYHDIQRVASNTQQYKDRVFRHYTKELVPQIAWLVLPLLNSLQVSIYNFEMFY